MGSRKISLEKVAVTGFLLLFLSSAVSAAGSGRVEPEIDYRYSSLVLDLNSSREVFFQVKNPTSETREFESTVSGAGSSFSSSGTVSTGPYLLSPGEQKRFIISIDPDSAGPDRLVVDTQNMETGLNTTASVPVEVRKYPAVSSTVEVPGIGGLQLVMLLLVSAYLYSARL